jgi:hypothetical protein
MRLFTREAPLCPTIFHETVHLLDNIFTWGVATSLKVVDILIIRAKRDVNFINSKRVSTASLMDVQK